MQYKYRINLEGDNRSKIAATLLESFDIEEQTTSDESIYIVAWSRRFRLDELVELSETYPLSKMNLEVMQDTIQLRCTINAGEVIWIWEVDFTPDVDPDLSCLCETTEDSHLLIPSIVVEETRILSMLRRWDWSGDEVKVKEYSEVEIAEMGMVTNSQMREPVQSGSTQASSVDRHGMILCLACVFDVRELSWDGPKLDFTEDGGLKVDLRKEYCDIIRDILNGLVVQAGNTQVSSVGREAEHIREPDGTPVCVKDFSQELANIDGGSTPDQRTELTKGEYHDQLILDLRSVFDVREGSWNGTDFDFTEDGVLKVDLRKKDCDLIRDILSGVLERQEKMARWSE
jgi:hypothetical protein